MRFILPYILTCILSGCSSHVELGTQLKDKHWFVQAAGWETEHTAIFSNDSTKKYEWEAKFYPNGKMFYAAFFPVNFRDANGFFHLKGERFTDTLYTYQVKDNILKVTKGDEIYYLKFVPKPGDEFIITPAVEKDFD
ncbi:MAG: hypothetical protein ACXVC7_03005 [Bacteroidia bacterium]